MGGSLGFSKSSSSSSSFDRSKTFIDQLQGQFRNQLFGAAGNIAQGQLGQVGQFGQQFSQDLVGQGQGGLNTLFGAADPNVLNQQLGALNQFSQQNLRGSLGQIGQNAIGSGGFGGTAQGLAQGEAIGQSNTAFNLGASQLIGNQQQLAQQGAAQGLGALGGLVNLGLGGFNAEFQPLQNLAQLLGPATVLSQADREGQSKSSSMSVSASGGIA